MVIFRSFQAPLAILIFVANIAAQSPPPRTPVQTPSGMPPPAPSKSPALPGTSPSTTPTTEDLVNSLGPADLQAVLTLLKSNFTDSDAITDTELNRATVECLMERLPAAGSVF